MMRLKNYSKIFRMITLIVFLYAWYWMIGDAIHSLDLPHTTSMLLLILALSYIAAKAVTNLLHVLGHFVFGLLTGYRFVKFQFGKLALVKVQHRLRFDWQPSVGTSGQCVMQPPAMKDGEYPFMLYYLGGIILNLLQLIAILFVRVYTINGSVAHEFSFFFASYVFYFILINAVPFLAKGKNDISNLLPLIQNKANQEDRWYLLKIAQFQATDTFLKDMPEEWFPQPEAWDVKRSDGLARALTTCVRYLGLQDFVKCKQLFFKLLEMEKQINSPGIVNGICVELLFCAILTDEAPETILQLQARLPESWRFDADNNSICRLLYAEALLLNHDQEAADAARENFEKALTLDNSRITIRRQQDLMACVDRIAIERGIIAAQSDI